MPPKPVSKLDIIINTAKTTMIISPILLYPWKNSGKRRSVVLEFLFWRRVRRVGKKMRCSSLRIHRLRVGSQTMETVGIFVASRRNNGTRISPSLGILNHFHGEKQRSSSASLILIPRLSSRVSTFVEMLRAEREERPLPSLCHGIAIERFRK